MTHATTHTSRAHALPRLLLLTTAALVFAAPAAAQKRATQQRGANAARAVVTYACPMDADVKSKSPGRCRKCGMKLVKVAAPADATRPAPDASAPPSASAPASTSSAPASSAASPDAGGVTVPIPAPPAATADAGKDAEARRKLAAASAKYFPSHLLLTQDGRQVKFYDDLVKGKVVLINFMFTTCAGVCSPMTANLAKVQQYLGERLGREVSILSISVDPQTDTPEVLKAYAARHKAGPGWTFLTGKKENVDWVLYKLGGYTADKAQHSSVLIIGNEATGEWMKTHAMAKPAEIASSVLKMLAPAAR